MDKKFYRLISILSGPATHLDHLAVFSHLIDSKLIITNRFAYKQCKEFYPMISQSFSHWDEISLREISANYDGIITSSRFTCTELLLPLSLYKKRMRFIYCPHGHSDKGLFLKEEDHPLNDITLVYGTGMIEHLKKIGALSTYKGCIVTGHFRKAFYQLNQSHFDALAKKHVFSQLPNNPYTLFYAPTWSSNDSPSSFLSLISSLLDNLPDEVNLICKPHPFYYDNHLGKMTYIEALFEKKKNALLIKEFPPIFPLLEFSDAYLGDYSSIGYDALSCNKPLFLLHPFDREVPLSKAGLLIPPDQWKNPYSFILSQLEKKDSLVQNMRLNLSEKIFSPCKDFNILKKALFEKLSVTDIDKERIR